MFDNLSAYQNVELAVLATGVSRSERHGRIMAVLERVRLTELHDQPARVLSHGQRQWLEIGLLIGNQAKLLLLDEPTAGMTAEEIAATLRAINENEGMTIIIVEQNVPMVFSMASDCIILEKGKVIVRGSCEEVQGSELMSTYLAI